MLATIKRHRALRNFLNQINCVELEKLFDDLALKEWACSEKIFTLDYCRLLAQRCLLLHREGCFQPASVGKADKKVQDHAIRGDFTLWIEENTKSVFLIELQEQIDMMLKMLNQNFYLGLKRFEAHFAVYPPGSEYKKHMDNHKRSNSREITFILYLNDVWKKGDGGELSFFQPDNHDVLLTQIEPNLGTLVLFRSKVFPHQVEKNRNQRLSLTGWFRMDS